MRRIPIMLMLALFVFACKVEKTGKDTYKVVAPTPEAKAATEKVKEQAKVAGEKLKQGTANAAEKLGGELQEAGAKAKAKTERTTTTSTVETQTGTKTETRSKTSTRY